MGQSFLVLGPSEELRKASNHIVYKIRGDEFGLTAIEVESKLRSKLRENFEVNNTHHFLSIEQWTNGPTNMHSIASCNLPYIPVLFIDL